LGYILCWSQDSSVGIATGQGADSRSSIPAGVKDFSPLHNIQSGSGTHPASYPVGTGAVSPEVKRPGCEADQSPPSSADVKNGGPIHPRLHGMVLSYLNTGTNFPFLPFMFYAMNIEQYSRVTPDCDAVARMRIELKHHNQFYNVERQKALTVKRPAIFTRTLLT
jgi:hypothetical protein